MYSIIPQPSQLVPHEGQFTFRADTKFLILKADSHLQLSEDFHFAAHALTDIFIKSAGFIYEVNETTEQTNESTTNTVIFEYSPDITNNEGYKLNISPNLIRIIGSTSSGLFYGTQTIRQLLPPDIERQQIVESRVIWTVPCLEIIDYPQYQYRGLMLDCSRHFSNAKTVMRYIDKLSYFKLNRFHWHLTDDQGWRIEIKAYPKLTEISAFRRGTKYSNTQQEEMEEQEEEDKQQQLKDQKTDSSEQDEFNSDYIHEGKYGGFYSQEEIREVVEFARRRFITIIPEIEMPGHSLSVFAAYPQFSCKGASDDKAHFDVLPRWGIFRDVFCMREETFQFLETVLTEVVSMFPYSQLIHIGGDECPKDRWMTCQFCKERAQQLKIDTSQLQTYFENRIIKFVSEKLQRRVVGWDEIMNEQLPQDVVVMQWRGQGPENVDELMGHDTIYSPQSHCYFDYYQSQRSDEPHAIYGFLPLELVYQFDPLQLAGLRKDGLNESEKQGMKHILGGQGNVWREYFPNTSHTDYMIFPRACALAETLWSPYAQKDYNNFRARLNPIVARLEVMKVNYCNVSLIPQGPVEENQVKEEK
ncbi:MAG: putative glycoside hydrolase family 20 [Streblomastix strix]|uniref:Beta-hexosaminidase n=1 Tax=Streblomastix strix TaxID=222440 RepID=A0A5J4WEA6_9EUKA|nr:MAG: putative glycoside hydrolase family 20 [Streblomastix strix]